VVSKGGAVDGGTLQGELVVCLETRGAIHEKKLKHFRKRGEE